MLEGGWWLGVELGDQGAGVAGAEPSSGGQLPSADRGAGSAEFGIDALGPGALGQHLSAHLDALNIHPSMRLRIDHYPERRSTPYIG